MPDLPKKMSDFQRQHPVAALSRAFGLIRGNIVTILVFLFVGAQSESFPFLWWTLGGFAFLLVVGFANWWRFLFKVEDGLIHIKSGIFVRKNLYLTKDRIQVIDITAGIIQGVFGLVQLDIQTAGASSRAASIEAITRDKAEEINRLLRQKKSGAQNQESDSTIDVEDEVKQTITLPNKELLIAASTSGSFGIALSVIGTVFSQVEPLISESQFYDYLYSILPSQTDAMFYVAFISGFIVFAWLLSFFGTLFNYGNFSLEIKEKEIVISRGIFEKKRSTVPFNRIQAIHISEGIIRQPLGYASLHLESAAGYGDDKGSGSILFFPLIKRERIISLLDEVLPDYQKELNALTLPSRSLRRYIFRSTFFTTIITAATWWWLDLNLVIWILPLLAILWGWLKYKDTALGWGEDIMVLRSRTLSKSTAYIKKKRIQDISISQSPFQRYRDLCSVEVYVASGDRGKSFSVRDVELEDGLLVFEQLKLEGVNTTIDESLQPEANRPIIKLPGWA